MMKKYCELKNEERRINMKIEQQNQIKEFLNEEFGVDKGKELFNKGCSMQGMEDSALEYLNVLKI